MRGVSTSQPAARASAATHEAPSPVAEPATVGSGSQPVAATAQAFDFAQWIDGNKRSVAMAGAGVVGLLLAIVAFRFVLSIDFGGRSAGPDVSAKPASTQQATLPFQGDIPTPLVPITPAAAVMPKWDQREDISGNYPILTGLYVGALGKRTFKLVVSTADTLNKRMSGYSQTSTGQTAFEGSFTSRIEQPNSRVADNVISVQTWVFEATMFEPRGIGGNGVFKLRFDCTDAQGRSVTGTWTSYDGRLYREIKLWDTITAADR